MFCFSYCKFNLYYCKINAYCQRRFFGDYPKYQHKVVISCRNEGEFKKSKLKKILFKHILLFFLYFISSLFSIDQTVLFQLLRQLFLIQFTINKANQSHTQNISIHRYILVPGKTIDNKQNEKRKHVQRLVKFDNNYTHSLYNQPTNPIYKEDLFFNSKILFLLFHSRLRYIPTFLLQLNTVWVIHYTLEN